VEQHSLVHEKRKSVKCLFDSMEGESSKISGEGLSTSGKFAAGSDIRTYFHAKSARADPDGSGWINWWSSLWRSTFHLPSTRNRSSVSETCVIACMMSDSELSGRVHSYNSNV
jgi:hypothetical protein